MFRQLFIISLAAVLTENFVLVQMLGVTPFLSGAKKIENALKTGGAVTALMVCSSAATWAAQKFMLEPLELEYMQTVCFVLVIAGLVQLARKYVPLITTTVNCMVLGAAIINIERFGSAPLGFLKSLVNGTSAGVGFTLAAVLFAGLLSRVEKADIPKCLRGAPIALITAALMSMAFMGFAGLSI